MTVTRKISGQANEGILGERLRISQILDSKEGRARPGAAAELALRSDLTADQAIALLAKTPVANPFMDAMDREGEVGLVGQSPSGNGGMLTDERAARMAELQSSIQYYNASKGYRKAR
jgi:hypothetical protein